jgi:hypothetical protein
LVTHASVVVREAGALTSHKDTCARRQHANACCASTSLSTSALRLQHAVAMLSSHRNGKGRTTEQKQSAKQESVDTRCHGCLRSLQQLVSVREGTHSTLSEVHWSYYSAARQQLRPGLTTCLSRLSVIELQGNSRWQGQISLSLTHRPTRFPFLLGTRRMQVQSACSDTTNPPAL